MTAPYPYDTQLALVASINATQTFLREGFFKPSYVKAVENLLNIWTKEVTNPKLMIPLPRCKDDVHLSIGTDDWGVHFISYGNRDEMTELVNIILEWKYKAEQFDKLPVKLVESPEFAIGLHMEKKNELL